MLRIVIALILLTNSLATAESDVMDRASRSAWLPTFSIRYAHQSETPHAVFAALTWDFDDFVLGSRLATALEIRRLEREARYFEHSVSLLRHDLTPSFD